MLIRRWLNAAALACSALLATPTVHAGPVGDLSLAYTVNLSAPLPAITNIITFNTYLNGGGGASWASEVPAEALTHTLVDVFPKDSANPPVDALLMGLVRGLPGDADPEQLHVVMLMSNPAAALASGQAFSTLFANTVEADLIAAIQLATSGLPIDDILPGLDFVDAFVNGDARSGIVDGEGNAVSAWIDLGLPAPGTTVTSDFSVLAFSSGQLLGTGVASVTAAVTPVPEPGSVALALLGLALLLSRQRLARKA